MSQDTDEVSEPKRLAEDAADHFGKRTDIYSLNVITREKPGFTTTHEVRVEFDEGTPFRTFKATAAGLEALGADRTERNDGVLRVRGYFFDPNNS